MSFFRNKIFRRTGVIGDRTKCRESSGFTVLRDNQGDEGEAENRPVHPAPLSDRFSSVFGKDGGRVIAHASTLRRGGAEKVVHGFSRYSVRTSLKVRATNWFSLRPVSSEKSFARFLEPRRFIQELPQLEPAPVASSRLERFSIPIHTRPAAGRHRFHGSRALREAGSLRGKKFHHGFHERHGCFSERISFIRAIRALREIRDCYPAHPWKLHSTDSVPRR